MPSSSLALSSAEWPLYVCMLSQGTFGPLGKPLLLSRLNMRTLEAPLQPQMTSLATPTLSLLETSFTYQPSPGSSPTLTQHAYTAASSRFFLGLPQGACRQGLFICAYHCRKDGTREWGSAS